MSRAAATAGFVVLLLVLLVLSTLGTLGIAAALTGGVLLTATALLGAERWGRLLLLAGLLTAPMNLVRPIAAVDLVTFSDLLMVIGFVLLAPRLLTRWPRVPIYLILGGGVVLVVGVLAGVASAGTGASLGYLARMLAAAVFMPLAFLLSRPTRRQVTHLAWAYALGQVISTGYALAAGKNGDRYVGLTTHPNFFGMCGALAVGVCLHLIHVGSARTRAAAVAVLLVCGTSVIMSGSRAALLAVALVALMYPLLERSKGAGYGLALGGAVVVALANATLLPGLGSGSAISRLSGSGSAAGSDDQRTSLLQEGLHEFLTHPFLGTGFRFETTQYHNGYLEVASAIGIIGLLGYVAVLLGLLVPLLRIGDRNRLSYAVLGYVFISTFNNTLWDRFAWTALMLPLLWEGADRTESEAAPAEPSDGAGQQVALHAVPAGGRNA